MHRLQLRVTFQEKVTLSKVMHIFRWRAYLGNGEQTWFAWSIGYRSRNGGRQGWECILTSDHRDLEGQAEEFGYFSEGTGNH